MILNKSAHPCEGRDKDLLDETGITFGLTPAFAGVSGSGGI
ncbi:hypothetical protein N9M10_03360 [Hellea sp.]|nr:hypothetical protein [Hellea sp.]